MNYFIITMVIISSLFSQSAENQTFKLKDGTTISGTILEEDDAKLIIQTKYGTITINKEQLLIKKYEVNLLTGETYTGTKLSETDSTIQLKTNLGILTIYKSDILDMKEAGSTNSKDNSSELSESEINFMNKRSSSIFDQLFSSNTHNKELEFSLGEERLIDTFFDPTAYIIEDGTLYFSGLSYAFGISDKLQISSRWVDYIRGNLNIRPKYMLFHKGNWEKESALAIGGHFHTYWQPDKVVWQSGTVQVENTQINYGGYFPISSTISGKSYYSTWEDDHLIVSKTEDLNFMFEFFSAYTFSKARKGMRGRISSTIGGLIQVPMANGKDGLGDTFPYRIFASIDLDITSKLKLVGESFYDPFFLDLRHRSQDGNDDCEGPIDCLVGGNNNFTYKTDPTDLITEDDFLTIRNIHFDIGFIYAVNENFRFGIHSQPYIIAFYWKF